MDEYNFDNSIELVLDHIYDKGDSVILNGILLLLLIHAHHGRNHIRQMHNVNGPMSSPAATKAATAAIAAAAGELGAGGGATLLAITILGNKAKGDIL